MVMVINIRLNIDYSSFYYLSYTITLAERNFWKTHLDSNSLVDALITHINEKGKTLVRDTKQTKSSSEPLPPSTTTVNQSLHKSRHSNEGLNHKIPNLFVKKVIYTE